MRALLRTRLGIYGVIVIAVVLVTAVAVIGYRVYYTMQSSTPEKAVNAYLDAFSKGDMVKLYDLTLGAANQTQDAFSTAMTSLVKDKRLTASVTGIRRIGSQGNTYYFYVTRALSAGDGSSLVLPLILETAQEGTIWRVRIFVPPATLPSTQ